MSSTEARSAYPALLTTTSRRPNASIAACTAAVAWLGTATSWAIVTSRSPCAATKSARASGRRAVASTRSPLSSAASTTWRPRPRELPVTSQTLDMRASPLLRSLVGVLRSYRPRENRAEPPLCLHGQHPFGPPTCPSFQLPASHHAQARPARSGHEGHELGRHRDEGFDPVRRLVIERRQVRAARR